MLHLSCVYVIYYKFYTVFLYLVIRYITLYFLLLMLKHRLSLEVGTENLHTSVKSLIYNTKVILKLFQPKRSFKGTPILK